MTQSTKLRYLTGIRQEYGRNIILLSTRTKLMQILKNLEHMKDISLINY
jgi:hypothetical protein